MNRSTLVPVLVASLAFVLGAFLLARAVRYEVVPAEEGENVAWLVDRATGDTWKILYDERRPVEPAEPSEPEGSDPAAKERHDALARGRSFRVKDDDGYEYTVDRYARLWLERARGPIEVEGWHVKKVGEGKYLVTFAFTHDGHRYGWAIEVLDLPGDGWVTRNALADPELRKLYGLENLEPPPPLPKD